MKPLPTTHNRECISTSQHDNRVAILLATFNGAEHLEEQLDSLVTQTHGDWIIYASDDGSRDNTLTILEHYQSRLGTDRLIILKGPCRGYFKNFMSLIKNLQITTPYFAFCDQDDIWYADRLEKGLAWMADLPHDQPALFCSRTELVDSQGHTIGMSNLFASPPSFENAMVQSISGGNTMLINQASRELICQSSDHYNIVAHDWWTYLLVSGAGGLVNYSHAPTIRYRQHEHNLVGSNTSFTSLIIRIKKMLSGKFREWNNAHIMTLNEMSNVLTDENRKKLNYFDQARSAPLVKRLCLLKKSGAHRQTLFGNLGLIVAALLNKL